MKKTVLTSLKILCLLSAIVLVGLSFSVRLAKAVDGIIYIRADGSIDPPIAPISSSDNITYTFTDSLYLILTIRVERSNIAIEGAGFTIQGTGSEIGMNLTSVSNVTIRNLEIKDFQHGVRLYQSSNNKISGNTIKDNWCGIWIQNSSSNSVSDNTLENNTYGTWIFASDNTFYGNTVINNTDTGVVVDIYSSNNTIYENTIASCSRGVWLIMASDNKFYHNNFLDNTQHVDIPWLDGVNIWDDGYPSGGNHWSGYAVTDLHSGLYQNETGRDGIGDTAYTIDANNTDHYPLMTSYSPIYQGDFVLTGNDLYAIEGRFDINGRIIVEENATLILRNAVLNFTQNTDHQFSMTFRNPSNGNPRLVVENAKLAMSDNYYMRIQFLGNSSVSIDNLTVLGRPLLWFKDYSVASLSNSSLYSIAVYDSSSLSLFNCTLETLYAWEHTQIDVSNSHISHYVDPVVRSINCSIIGLKPGFISYWNFKLNCSVVVGSDGWAPNITLTDTQVDGWSFDIDFGFSNVAISNSKLYNLWAAQFTTISFHNSTINTDLWIYDSSRTTLYNTTVQELHSYQDSKSWLVNSTGNVYDVNDQSEVYVSWYLEVHVVDSNGTDVPSANVTAYYPNATIAGSKLTDSDGSARLTLMEKMINATGTYSIENYTIEATYETYSDSETVNMTENKQMTIQLPFIIPEFPSLIILPFFMIVMLLAILAYKRKQLT